VGPEEAIELGSIAAAEPGTAHPSTTVLPAAAALAAIVSDSVAGIVTWPLNVVSGSGVRSSAVQAKSPGAWPGLVWFW
jgi:hypothetical protein